MKPGLGGYDIKAPSINKSMPYDDKTYVFKSQNFTTKCSAPMEMKNGSVALDFGSGEPFMWESCYPEIGGNGYIKIDVHATPDCPVIVVS